MLSFIPNLKYKKMCDKTVDYYPHALEFVPDCCKTKKICNKVLAA